MSFRPPLLLVANHAGAAVDDRGGGVEAFGDHFLRLDAVVAHREVHDVVAGVDERQHLAVALANGIPVFFYRGTAFAAFQLEGRLDSNQTAVLEGVSGHLDVLPIGEELAGRVAVGGDDKGLCVFNVAAGFFYRVFLFHVNFRLQN